MDTSQGSTPTAGGGGNGGSSGNGILNPQVNNSSSVTVADDPKQNLNQVINSIQKNLGLIHQLYLTVSSFNTTSQLPLLERLNSLVKELDNMAKLSEKCNIQVPMEILNLIDDGKNPDEFTRDVINSCITKNQITKGKTDAFKSLRKHLLEELEQTFPDEVESYREIRAASAAIEERISSNTSRSFFFTPFHLISSILHKFADYSPGCTTKFQTSHMQHTVVSSYIHPAEKDALCFPLPSHAAVNTCDVRSLHPSILCLDPSLKQLPNCHSAEGFH